MTDREDNGRDQTPPGFGLPTAGRKPPAEAGAAYGAPSADRETRYVVPPDEEETAYVVPPGRERSRAAGEPAYAVPGEEETARVTPGRESAAEPAGYAVPDAPARESAADRPHLAAPGSRTTGDADAEVTREGEPGAGETSATSPDPSMSDTPEPADAERDLDRAGDAPGAANVPAAPSAETASSSGAPGGSVTAEAVVAGAAAAGRPGAPAGPAPGDAAADARQEPETAPAGAARPGSKRPAPAGTLIWVLLALFGFTLVVQLRSNDVDSGLSTARQEDLVQILSDLEARDSRLASDIETLERSKQQLTSGVAGREAALEEANKRSQELGLLAGTIAGRGPGLEIVLDGVKASDVLNTVQELRGSGGEVMQVSGADGTSVRIVASTYFVDAAGGGIIADGDRLTGPFRLLVIGSPETMRTALQIPGGVVASVKSDGGSVTMDSRSTVEVTAVRKATALQYARPVS
ncbi:DUF881 domain-containing protein [Actinoplanes teichomyceticus]|uniref:Uncharacterized protein YlxW (UPF0749 family) n=1 Tax=Actinoplanes teichomyceticus TaxID=1867 RepID=A0A561VKM6_ACTTI|nr:DUF881 domain-containing protein [Actinoplanes teichomyceticus]TWG12179.1 uncharacterized protein YlxW (UPF0749 family) [Actinoplanes teichomyceticus]GIF14112.1 hypothetical protein Ate01nite_41440 [Actinoplanes teichomyceticus]